MSLTKVSYSMINGPMVCVTDYGAVCDGVTNDYAAIMSAHDNAPDGATILVKGACFFTSPLVFTRRVNWLCPGEADFFKPNVGASADAITIKGGITAANLQSKINIFSITNNSCRSGLVLRQYFMSTMESRVAVNGTAFSFEVYGALESQFYLKSSPNWTTPLGSPFSPPNHLKIDIDTVYKTNASQFYLNFAGAVNGVICADMSNEGDNTFRGTIQGLTGTPFSATGCQNLKITEFHFEGNPVASALNSCTNASIENVISAVSGQFDLNNCIGTTVKNYIGGLFIGSGTTHTKIIDCRIDGDTYTDLSQTTEIIGGGITSSSSSTSLTGGGGASALANFFQNPFMDIWTGGTAAAPDGFAAVSATFTQSTSIFYGLGFGNKSAFVTSTATQIANMAVASPTGPFGVTVDARWISFVTAVYAATGQPDVVIYVFDGASYAGFTRVSTKNAWVAVRGSALILANSTPQVVYAPVTGSSFVAGNFYIGGLSMVNGTTAPKYLIDSGRRLEYVVNSVSNAPGFVGQRAYLSGTGKWYMAAGIASNADWIILN